MKMQIRRESETERATGMEMMLLIRLGSDSEINQCWLPYGGIGRCRRFPWSGKFIGQHVVRAGVESRVCFVG